MSRLSINTTKSLRIAHAVLMVAASSISADSVERFFLAPNLMLYLGFIIAAGKMEISNLYKTFPNILL